MNRAVKLLAAKPRSAAELRERLLEKEWTDAKTVDAVIEKLKEYRYVDDQQFARDVAGSALARKPQGRYRLRQSLSRKQLEKETVDAALDAAFERFPESELIDRAIEKRVAIKGVPSTRDETKKFYDHLLRLGFSFDLVRDKLRELAGRAADDE